MSETQKFKDFNIQYMVGQKDPNHDELKRAADLILDELKELYQEIYQDVQIVVDLDQPRKNINLKHVAKEFTDIRYITGERMTMFDFDVDALDTEVHYSNMSKVVPLTSKIEALEMARKRYPDAIVTYNDNDKVVLYSPMQRKVIKPEQFYTPARITDKMIGK